MATKGQNSRKCWRRLACRATAFLLAWLLTACGGSGGPGAPAPSSSSAATPLSAADVQQVIQNAIQSVNVPTSVAVSDRAGNILAVFQTPGAPAKSIGNFGASVDTNELAVALARTAALFSNDQAPLSSRTVRFISGVHFPPGVAMAPNADLYGIENTNRGCPLNATFNAGQAVSPSRSINGSSPGLGIITGKLNAMDSDPAAVNPGGVPLFKYGHAVGGIGVAGPSGNVAEFAAFSGASLSGFLPTAAQLPPPG